MSLRITMILSMFLGPAAAALEAPASIENARIELRTGTAPAAAIDQAARDKGATWVGWSVTAVPDAHDACCFGSNFKSRGCSLDERDRSWGTNSDGKPTGPVELYVFVETKDNQVSRVRTMSPSCPVNGADRRLVWLGPVDSGASLAALDRVVDADGPREKVRDAALIAIAYHQDAKADAILERRAFDRSLGEQAREQAIFWAGQMRGEAGYRMLDRVLTSEPDGDLRRHAAFSLSQSDVPQAPERIKRVAVEDKDSDVRAHAYFSLSQTEDPGVGAWIVNRLDLERDDDVRDQAVFALSQLDDGTDWLLKVLRTKQRDPETARRALFWLGQSNDPRAIEEIEKILNR